MNINPEIVSLIDGIRNDKTHGASQLTRQAAEVMKLSVEHSRVGSVEQFLSEQREVGERLMSARPAMAPIFNIVNHLLKVIADQSIEANLTSIRNFAIAKADEVIEESLQAVTRIAQYGSELIADGDRIMTHSYSSTVMAVFRESLSKHRNVEVIVTRSGPGRTGERVAQELSSYGMTVAFVDDAAMGLYAPTVHKVMVGADRVCADGKVINGIGTYQLALAAKMTGVPFYIFCETLKFDPRIKSDEVNLEEKEPFEVVEPGRLPLEVRVRNPYFDVMPLELATGIVTENGFLTPQGVINYLKKLPT